MITKRDSILRGSCFCEEYNKKGSKEGDDLLIWRDNVSRDLNYRISDPIVQVIFLLKEITINFLGIIGITFIAITFIVICKAATLLL